MTLPWLQRQKTENNAHATGTGLKWNSPRGCVTLHTNTHTHAPCGVESAANVCSESRWQSHNPFIFWCFFFFVQSYYFFSPVGTVASKQYGWGNEASSPSAMGKVILAAVRLICSNLYFQMNCGSLSSLERMQNVCSRFFFLQQRFSATVRCDTVYDVFVGPWWEIRFPLPLGQDKWCVEIWFLLLILRHDQREHRVMLNKIHVRRREFVSARVSWFMFLFKTPETMLWLTESAINAQK